MTFLASKAVVVTRMKAKSGSEEKLKQKLISLASKTESEDGCINYNLHRAVHDGKLFMLYENWTSEEEMDGHLEMPHIKAFVEKVTDLLDSPPEITLWEMIG